MSALIVNAVLLAQANPEVTLPTAGSSSGLYTAASMATLAGASTLTLLISNALQSSLNFNPKWLALAIAQAFSIAGISFTKGVYSGETIFVAVVNGFVIYSAAIGINRTGGSGGGGRGAATTQGLQSPQPRRGFWTPWW